MVNIEEKAPDFELPSSDLKMKKLSDYKGNNVVLAFFPGAFTSVCTKEMCSFRDSMEKFNDLNAKVIGISVDTPFSLDAFKKQYKLNFELLSDPSKKVIEQFAGLHKNFLNIPNYHVSKRAVFVVDKHGMIKHVWVSEDPGKEPDYAQIQNVLNKLD
jgi:peroxiredoxin